MKTRFLLLALPLTTLPLLFQQPAAATIRDELTAVYAEWSKARTDFDKAKFEALLAPDFFVQVGPTHMTRQEFIDQISKPAPGVTMSRFDSRILTLNHEGDTWIAVITEKLEYEGKGADGKPAHGYSLWVTKDSFRKDKDGGSWRVLSSEAIGWETWNGGKVPPFADWKA